MSAEVQNFGKILYVEPNDFLTEELYGEHGGHYNLTPPYEDYNISVDLIVNMPNRFGEITEEKISFFGGNKSFNGIDKFLSDIPGSTTYKDIINGNTDGVNENLGISNIHITYNSYFIPEVTINFTDIRGGSLFMINEAIYQQESMGNKSNVDNFFGSLFHFPYPEFKLQVKGFYGCKVEYSLLVVDFKSSFNSQTGNFDATVKFVGKMYGVYSDIPMIYLFVAPYCKYGSDNNTTIWERKGFKIDDAPMPTFLQLKEKCISATVEFPTSIDYNNKQKYLDICEKNKIIHEIKSELDKLCDNKEDYKEYLFYGDEKLVIEYIQEAEKTLDNIFNSLNGKIEKFNSGDNKINNIFNTNLRSIKNFYEIYYRSGNIYEVNNNNETGNKVDLLLSKHNDVHYEKLLKKIKEDLEIFCKVHDSYSGSKKYKVIDLKEFRINLNNNIEKTINEKDEIENLIHNDVNDSLVSIFGFKPTIGNIFKILMAHLDCFTDLYNTLINNIGNNRDKNILNSYKTDVSKNNKYIPPFPGIINNNEYCYPPIDLELEECNFIESIFSCIEDFAESNYNLSELEKTTNENPIELIPTCSVDYLTNSNPYKNIFKDSNLNKLSLTMTYFGYRCISYFLFEGIFSIYNDKRKNVLTPEEFGKLEAYNFFIKNAGLTPKETEEIRNMLSDEFNAASFINYLTTEKKYGNVDNYYTYNSDSKTLLKLQDNKLSLKENLKYPAIINRDGNGLKSLHLDMAHETPDFSFAYDKSVPYKYISAINEDYVKEFRENVNKANIDADLKKKITEKEFKLNDSSTNIVITKFNDNIYLRTEGDTTDNSKYLIYINKRNIKNVNNDKIIECGNINLTKGNNLSLLRINYINALQNDIDFLNYFFINDYYHDPLIYDTIMRVSYRTLLYIGMIMYNILNDNKTNLEKIEKHIENIYYYEKKDVYVYGTYGNTIPFYFSYTHIVAILLPILFRKKDGSTIQTNFIKRELNKQGENYKTSDFFELIKKTYKDKDGNNDYIDCLGLIDEYKKWKDSKEPGGFRYFQSKYGMNNLKFTEFTELLNVSLGECFDKGGVTPGALIGPTNETEQKKFKDTLNNYIYNQKRFYFYDIFSKIFVDWEVYYESKDNPEFKTIDAYLELNSDYHAYQYLNDFVNKNKYLIIPHNFYTYSKLNLYNNEKNSIIGNLVNGGNIDKTVFIRAFDGFKSKLKALFEKNDTNKSVSAFDSKVNTESKLSMYLTLKNLYDKHFYELPKNIFKFDLKNTECDYNKIHYVDTFYNNLKDKLLINLNYILEIINNVTNGYNGNLNTYIKLSDMSVYSFMSLLCQKHNMMLLAMPFFNGNMKGDDLKEMFTVNNNPNVLSGPSYVCFYSHKPSQHLDIPNSQYENDGFDITDTTDLNDTKNFENYQTLNDLEKGDNKYKIPAFGIEFGSQRQSIFKDINVNMDNPQTTEVAVATQFDLIQKQNNEPKTMNYYGQDLYKVYTNYSYTCQANMMGCAQIQPLMYFQLNNIPMFRGAYQIIQVEHDITPGNMTTSFRGVRINRNKVPLVKTCINLNNIKDIIDKSSNKHDNSKYKTNESVPTTELKSNINNNFTYEKVEINSNNKDTLYDYDMLIKMPNIKFYETKSFYKNNNEKDAFNEVNPDLRCILYNISKKAEEYYPNIKLCITSSTRLATEKNKASDHAISDTISNINNTPSLQRKEILANRITLPRKKVEDKEYLILNNNYYTWSENYYKLIELPSDSTENNTINVLDLKTPISELGCALDITTEINNTIDKTQPSIQIFDLIATEFTNCIRQLIWEVSNNTPSSQDSISNCIHLASYGQDENDKRQIFVGKSTNGKWKAVKVEYTNGIPNNLPPSFIKILYKLSEDNTKYNSIYLNNFDNNKPTREQLEKWVNSYDN